MNLSFEAIAKAIRCPAGNVEANWPAIKVCLDALGMDTDNCYIAALATVAIETAFTFRPIRELGSEKYLNDHYDTRADLGNTPERDGDGAKYCGRGYVQITGEANYAAYGKLLGVPLTENPDLALDSNVAASILAAYFRDHHVKDSAEIGDWSKVRKKVNGGLNGWADFIKCVNALDQELAK